MKKCLLLIVSFLFFISAYSQKRSQTDPTVSLRNKTVSWFKTTYVEHNFKDPYSYKLMKCTLRPVTLQEKLEDNQRDVSYKLKISDTTDYFGDYQKTKRDALKAEADYQKKLNDSDTTGLSFSKKFYETLAWYHNNKKSDFLKIKELQKEVDNLKNTSTQKDLEEIVEYTVYLDAYGKNSLGNSVLGKYYYKIDKSGKTISEVKMFD